MSIASSATKSPMKPSYRHPPTILEQALRRISYGKVIELTPAEAALLAPHIETHQHTYRVAASGLPPQSFDLLGGSPTVAIEWIREEPNPQKNEPPLNVNRYLFGLTPDGSECVGYDVTEKIGQKKPVPGTVFPHWPTDFEELWERHFPSTTSGG